MDKDSKHNTNNNQFNIENYFKIPEGYFEELPGRISEKIGSDFSLKPRKGNLLRSVSIISGMAAAVAAILIMFSFLSKQPANNQSKGVNLAGFDQAITEYLEDNLDETTLFEACSQDISFFDANKLKEIIASDDTIKKTKADSFKMDTSLKKEDIQEYLENENIDPETL